MAFNFRRALEHTLTKQDLAEHLRLEIRSLDRKRKAGTVPEPDIDFPGFVRWLPASIRKWERKNKK